MPVCNWLLFQPYVRIYVVRGFLVLLSLGVASVFPSFLPTTELVQL